MRLSLIEHGNVFRVVLPGGKVFRICEVLPLDVGIGEIDGSLGRVLDADELIPETHQRVVEEAYDITKNDTNESICNAHGNNQRQTAQDNLGNSCFLLAHFEMTKGGEGQNQVQAASGGFLHTRSKCIFRSTAEAC